MLANLGVFCTSDSPKQSVQQTRINYTHLPQVMREVNKKRHQEKHHGSKHIHRESKRGEPIAGRGRSISEVIIIGPERVSIQPILNQFCPNCRRKIIWREKPQLGA